MTESPAKKQKLDTIAAKMDLLKEMEQSSDVNKLRWDLSAEDISGLAEAIMEFGRGEYDKIASAIKDPTFENTLKVYADTDSFLDTVQSVCTFPKNTSASKEIRDASTEAAKKLSKFWVECSMRFDVFLAMKAFADTKPSLEGESKRLIERVMRDYQRAGMDLPEDKRAEVKKIKEQMTELSTTYAKNSNEENKKFEFSADELIGCPEDYLKARVKKDDDGKALDPLVYTVSLKYPDYGPAMKYCKVPATRKVLEHAFNSRNMPDNATILEKLCELRQKQADLLGFPTHADYILDVRMAKSPKTVLPFLEDLNVKLNPLWANERDILLKYKEEDCKELDLDFDGELHPWDMSYYMNIVENKDYQVDQETIKQYFPLSVVTKELLGIYQELLGLVFKEVDKANAWHEEVRLFQVYNAGTDDLIGMFYLDMHPRDGKYGHAAVWGLQPGCVKKDGTRQIPVAAGVMNFTKGNEDTPSLLRHNEVVTFFHEFGHVMHQICSLAQYSTFAGTAVERDFVEAPSQMLENWCWCKDGLARMSSHFKDDSKLPEDLVSKLVASKTAGAGYSNKRQLVFGLLDQTIHSQGKVDTAQTFNSVGSRVFPLIKNQPGTNKAASFGHLAGGYDAQYYGYMWSDVFSADMFESRFQKEGIFNQKVGLDYRRCILKPGGSRDASDMLRDFLGRDPKPEPFLRSIGLTVE